MRFLCLALSFALSAATAHGAETSWQEVAPGVSLRLISTGQVKPDGTTLLALEINMPESTKTYWRVPGDTGFPLELNFSGSRDVLGHKVLWPYPTRHVTPDYLDYVYFGHTVLPIEVQVANPDARVEIGAILGVCSDICVPAQAEFSIPIGDAAPDRANGLRIRQALATWPIPWEGDPAIVGAVHQDGDMLALQVDPSLDETTLIAASQSGMPVFGTPQKSPEPNLVLIPILGKVDENGLENQSVQLTFLTEMGAFEVTRTIGGYSAE